MRLTLGREDYERIISHAKSELPNEACGLIAGHEEDGTRTITKVYMLTNTDASNEHFNIDPKEQLQAVKDMRANGLQLLGNWHSHPESPARPSKEDIRLSFNSKNSYMILSLMDEPVLKSFHVENGDVTQEELVIE